MRNLLQAPFCSSTLACAINVLVADRVYLLGENSTLESNQAAFCSAHTSCQGAGRSTTYTYGSHETPKPIIYTERKHNVHTHTRNAKTTLLHINMNLALGGRIDLDLNELPRAPQTRTHPQSVTLGVSHGTCKCGSGQSNGQTKLLLRMAGSIQPRRIA